MNTEEISNASALPKKLPRDSDWPVVLFYLHIHILGVLGIYMVFSQVFITTTLFAALLVTLGVLGVTAGAHRLWAHNSYSASTTLKIFLMLCQTLAGQGPIYNWVLQHRLHHKHFRTELDPFNPSRGFWYAHLTCLTLKPHDLHKKAAEEIDMSDLENDKVVMFQKKYYWPLFFLFLLLSINAPAEYWGENLICSFVVIAWLRFAVVLHLAYLVHSGSRLWGLYPTDPRASDTNSVFFIDKSYWIQYHYTVPWDYLSGEYGRYGTDCTSSFIRVCSALGYAYNLKTLSSEAVREAAYQSAHTKKPLDEIVAELGKTSSLSSEEYDNSVKFI